MAITGGFGVMMDLSRGGAMRRWVMGRDGVKRWLDSGEPCKTEEPRDGSPPDTTQRPDFATGFPSKK
jgi:hypothetical protein